jgi:nitric oxide synthase-interacting protein
LQNLLSQKKDIKRHQATVEALKAEEASERSLAREAAKQRVLSDFEQSQSVMSSSSTAPKAAQDANKAERGIKRKFEMQDDEIDGLVSEAEERALKQLELEQAENRKAKLPAFWLPR